MKLNLFDESFSHSVENSSVAGQHSKSIEWVRDIEQPSNITFYSNGANFNSICTPKEKSYAWLFESQAIDPFMYKFIEHIMDKFSLVFTHSSALLEKYKNARWIPGGGIWVGGAYGEGSVEIAKKTKHCSMVSSSKAMCQLHLYRLELSKKFKLGDEVDVFGLDSWVPISQTLTDYKFSIVVENYIDKLYFTEKILNCFATGTIPIYLGASEIDKKFNKEGVLSFSSPEELESILSNIRTDKTFYEDRLDAIKDNFKRVQKYRVIEDYIYENYLND